MIVIPSNATPVKLQFKASLSHNEVTPAGPRLTNYIAKFFDATNNALVGTKDYGKPTPDANGNIIVDCDKTNLHDNIMYKYAVSSKGPGGESSLSPYSDDFIFITAPVAITAQPTIVLGS